MRTEARVIDLSRTEYGTYAALDTNRVIRNTYQLLALSTAVAGAGAVAASPWGVEACAGGRARGGGSWQGSEDVPGLAHRREDR